MIRLDLHTPYGPNWTHSPDGHWHVKGYIIAESGRLLQGEALWEQVASCKTGSEFAQWLLRANGAFAVIYQSETETWAAVDRIRSLPLWYSLRAGDVTLTDQPTHEAHFSPDPVQTTLFPYAGHTLGSHTLWRELKQIPAGDWLHIQQGIPQLKTYFSPARSALTSPSDAFSQEEGLLDLAIRVFERVLTSAPEAEWVVPLSGGYDSRFIAAMLKHMGCEAVTCFTYGRPGSYEVSISRQVAEKLGYAWHMVPYDATTLRPYVEQQGWEYQDFAAGMSSVAHEQDWTAVRMLREKGVLSDRSVFLPGFGGDVLAGSWLPNEEEGLWTPEVLVGYLTSQQSSSVGEGA